MTKKNKRVRAYQTGLWAEMLAAFFLRFKGFKILKQRYKTPVGEIDLIALKGNLLVFTEVKARKSKQEASNALSSRGKMRIEKAAGHFLMHYPAYENHQIRFDLVAISPPFCVHHLDNAWLTRA